MHEKKIIKNTEQNNNCVFIVLKAMYSISEPKHEEKNIFGVFLQKLKTCFLRVKIK